MRKKGDVSTVEVLPKQTSVGGEAKYVLALSLEQPVQVLEGDVLDLVGLGLHGSDLVNVLVVREPILEGTTTTGKEGESANVLTDPKIRSQELVRSRMVEGRLRGRTSWASTNFLNEETFCWSA
jgi:hypothetical protein